MADEHLKRRAEDKSFLGRMAPGDWIKVVLVSAGIIVAWTKTDARLMRLEEISAMQAQTNVKLELSIKEASSDLRNDIREVANTVRRIESKARGG